MSPTAPAATHAGAKASGSTAPHPASASAGKELVVVGGFADGSAVQVLELDTATAQLSHVSASKAGGIAPAWLAWQPSAPAAAASGAGHHAPSPALSGWLFVTNHARDRPGTGLTAVHVQTLLKDSSGGSDGDGSRRPAEPEAGKGPDAAQQAGSSTSFTTVPDPAHAAVAPSGRWVLSAAYDDGSVSVVPVLPGQDGGGLQLGQATVYPTEGVGKAPHQVLFDPTGRFVYVPCLASDWVLCLRFDDATGALTPLAGTAADSRVHLPAGSGPRHLALHPTLLVAYAVNELASTVVRLDWDLASGMLSAGPEAQRAQRVTSMLPPGTPAGLPIRAAAQGGPVQAAAALALSPDGRFLYASNRGMQGGHNSVAVFAVSPADGSLAPLAWEGGGGTVDFPRHISMAAGGQLLLVANQHTDSVAVFRRDTATGLLSLASVFSTAGVVSRPTFAAVLL